MLTHRWDTQVTGRGRGKNPEWSGYLEAIVEGVIQWWRGVLAAV
jgi:hypothetical protein